MPDVKIKGREAHWNGKVIATIRGWRDPSGKGHRP